MGWKDFEFWIVRHMQAGIGNQKDLIAPRRIGQQVQIRQQFFRAGHIQFSARQHEIRLRVHIPENDASGNHGVALARRNTPDAFSHLVEHLFQARAVADRIRRPRRGQSAQGFGQALDPRTASFLRFGK